MSIANITAIDGDLAVSRNVSLGGRLSISGSAQVERDLRVKGWLHADNVSSKHKGIFNSTAELNAAYPEPPVGEGWNAGVISSTEPATLDLYIVDANGDWADSGVDMEFSCDITGFTDKADKVSGATNGNFAGLDGNGNLTDSGKKPTDFVPKVSGATNGNFAGLNSNGTITDSGKKPTDFAATNGEYPLFVAGGAKTLVGTEQVDAIFSYREAAGSKDIDSGIAVIDKMLGNTVMMRQLVKNGDFSDDTTGWRVTGNNASMSVSDGVMTCHPNVQHGKVSGAIGTVIKGHKYLFSFDTDVAGQSKMKFAVWCGTSSTTNNGFFADSSSIPAVNGWQHVDIIGECPYTTLNDNAEVQLARGTSSDEADYPYQDIKVRNVMLFDLTWMFGLGLEPSAEDFHRMFPLNYYEWDNKILDLNNSATGIKLVAFNQFDYTNGTLNVMRGQTYEVVGNYTSIYYSDNNEVFVEDGFFTPEKTDTLVVVGGDSETCIHLVWSGKRNGETEPYDSYTIAIDITSVRGKLNGEGPSVTIFPDGMMSLGKYHDEMYGNVAIRRIKCINATDLTFEMNAGTGAFVSNIISDFIGSDGHLTELIIACNKYSNVLKFINNIAKYDSFAYRRYDGYDDKTCGAGQFKFGVKDTSMASLSEFNASLDGVKIYYVLATPEVYELDSNFEVEYKVDDFGTEEMLPSSSAIPTSAPISYVVKYPINAVDKIRRMNQTMINVESFENFCETLSTALGNLLDKSITIESVYSDVYERYTFNIVINDVYSDN